MMENNAATSNPAQQPAAVYIVIQQSGEHEQNHYKNHYPKKTGLILSSIQLGCAIISIITQIAMIVEAHKYYHYMAYVGSGIWCGIFFAVAGGLGIFAAMRPSACSVIANMVMSIIAAVFCIPMLTFAIIGLFQEPRYYYRNESYAEVPVNAMLVINIIQVLVILTEVVVAIIASAYGCRSCCCKPRSSPGTVLYNPSGKPDDNQFVQVPLNALPTAVTAIPATLGTDTNKDEEDHPPKYDDASLDLNGGKYQRF